MLRKWLVFVVALFLGFVLGLGMIFRPLVFQEAVALLAQFIWAVYRVFASVNQRVYWLVLNVAVLMMTYRTVFSNRKSTQPAPENDLEKPVGREMYWLETITNAVQSERNMAYFRGQLVQFLFSTFNKPDNSGNAMAVVSRFQPPLPAGLRPLFAEKPNEQPATMQARVSIVARNILQLAWWLRQIRVEQAYKEIGELLQSVEDYMEIGHEIRLHE